ncbi:MAG: DNA-3-methyladenine glycosylase 2 family protein [Clostridia bacterium]|nr:DNA-3-methyladenine glycosylase 2 family protein [Clostridia bacterium]
MNNITYKNGNVYIDDVKNFDLAMTLDCGQAFRWKEDNGVWSGVAFGKSLKISKENESIVFFDTSKEDFENIWSDYFDFSRDYGKIIDDIKSDEILKKASDFGYGIRILNQEPFETLCSFIISQNNNIPRIKGIIDRLCKKYGQKIDDDLYSFPDAETLSKLTANDLSDIRMGFRAKYIIDASQKVASGEVNLSDLFSLDTDTARTELMKIKGVGPKVADCTLLFSLKHFDAFPKDVWIKRAVEVLFPQGLPECANGYKGIVQQYIFYYSRSGNLNI